MLRGCEKDEKRSINFDEKVCDEEEMLSIRR